MAKNSPVNGTIPTGKVVMPDQHSKTPAGVKTTHEGRMNMGHSKMAAGGKIEAGSEAQSANVKRSPRQP